MAGTASHAGKSWMATALCRYLRRRGLRVAPFKAQNMSLNSCPCPAGGEIGRAQTVQAEAAGVEPTPDMNPILLKPNSTRDCQVVVNGKVWRNLGAAEYYTHYEYLLGQVLAAYRRLEEQFDALVLEGAGSAVELNLKDRDLVNLGLAVRLQIPAMLVADIDRGGVFASVVGTFALLNEEESALVRSFAINRFRGDPALFEDGKKILEERAGRPCLGVFPFLDGVKIDAEDSVSLDEPPAAAPGSGLRIAIVRLPRISNFTDFSLLDGAEYVTEPTREPPDLIILPGTKNTIADLRWLRARGLDHWIREQQEQGAAVWGICGGYQMLGQTISDPWGVESLEGSAEGIGLLPVETVLLREKTTRLVEARSASSGRCFRGYEIHMGETTSTDRSSAGSEPFALVQGRPEGLRANGILGTYLHGALEDPGLLAELLEEIARRRNKPPPPAPSRLSREAVYDRLAGWFEEHADLERFEALYLR